jgi:hypothetical protein
MSIPASLIANSIPGVIGGGGAALDLNGVILSQNTLLPTGQVQSFASAQAVGAYFGTSSQEYQLAQIYSAATRTARKSRGISLSRLLLRQPSPHGFEAAHNLDYL